MSALAAKNARRIFREALRLHYIEGLEGGAEISEWLSVYGGWFRDNQAIRDGEGPPKDHADYGRSSNPTATVRAASTLMMTLYTTLCIETSRMNMARILDGQHGGGSGNALDFKESLARGARNWLEDVVGLDPL
jgi:hypothetical protein